MTNFSADESDYFGSKSNSPKFEKVEVFVLEMAERLFLFSKFRRLFYFFWKARLLGVAL